MAASSLICQNAGTNDRVFEASACCASSSVRLAQPYGLERKRRQTFFYDSLVLSSYFISRINLAKRDRKNATNLNH